MPAVKRHQRINVSLDGELLRRIDAQLEGKPFNRSELLEHLLWAWLQGDMPRPGRIVISHSEYEGAGFVPW